MSVCRVEVPSRLTLEVWSELLLIHGFLCGSLDASVGRSIALVQTETSHQLSSSPEDESC